MKLYRTTYTYTATVNDSVETTRFTQWTGNQSDAGKLRAAGRKLKAKDVATQEVDVMTNKDGLLAFLNDLTAQR